MALELLGLGHYCELLTGLSKKPFSLTLGTDLPSEWHCFNHCADFHARDIRTGALETQGC